MKKIRLLIMTVLLVSTCAFSGSVNAQAGENSENDKQREEELLKAISEQKKALSEQRKAQADAEKEMQKSIRELEKLRDFDFDFDLDELGTDVRIYRRGKSVNPDVFVVPQPPSPPGAGSFIFSAPAIAWDDNTGTSWVFTKSVKENSFKKEYAFDVDETAKTVILAISGDCKAGDIRIKVVTPQGKTYSDVVIDEFGNINVRKSFNISDSENKDKLGEWKFLINSNSATGYFKISFQTY